MSRFAGLSRYQGKLVSLVEEAQDLMDTGVSVETRKIYDKLLVEAYKSGFLDADNGLDPYNLYDEGNS